MVTNIQTERIAKPHLKKKKKKGFYEKAPGCCSIANIQKTFLEQGYLCSEIHICIHAFIYIKCFILMAVEEII